jgi:hypothetical protein
VLLRCEFPATTRQRMGCIYVRKLLFHFLSFLYFFRFHRKSSNSSCEDEYQYHAFPNQKCVPYANHSILFEYPTQSSYSDTNCAGSSPSVTTLTTNNCQLKADGYESISLVNVTSSPFGKEILPVFVFDCFIY